MIHHAPVRFGPVVVLAGLRRLGSIPCAMCCRFGIEFSASVTVPDFAVMCASPQYAQKANRG